MEIISIEDVEELESSYADVNVNDAATMTYSLVVHQKLNVKYILLDVYHKLKTGAQTIFTVVVFTTAQEMKNLKCTTCN